MVRLLGALAAVACALTAHAIRSGASGRVTPVEKVISLLGQLSEQIQEEGKTEAAEYDKYACFCKEQLDSKSYAIDSSTEKIGALQATITALESDIGALNADIGALGTRITAIEGEVSDEEAARKAESDKYVIADENVTQAIKAVEGAIDTLRASKSEMSGAKLNLAQVQDTLSRLHVSDLAAGLLERAAQPGQPAAYTYNSNNITGVLQSLLVQFKKRKQSLFNDEHQLKSVSEKKVLGLTNEKTFKEKEKVQKEAIVGAKSADKDAAAKDKDDETKARDADIAFRTELTSQCESKATEWDQRSQARADELTALSEAVEVLRSGVNPNYGANKKLVGLQQKVAIHTQQDSAPPSFVQQVQQHKRSGGSASSAVAQRLLQLLDAEGARLHSPTLAAVATKVALGADNFVKVRGLIKDLVTKLEAEALAEASSKDFCDTSMAKAVADRDKEALNMEKEEAVRSSKEAKKAQLLAEIATLSKQVAELSKALNEATELRSDEKLDNQKTVAEAKAGKAAVEDAIRILKGFYGFVQSAAPGADRGGNTVGDLAPKTSYSGTYAGKTDASKGIFGLLQVILDDFDRTITAVETGESDAASKFTTFKSNTESDMDAKRTDKGNKENEITTTEADITAAQDAYMDAKRLHDLAVQELLNLESSCVEGEESWAERKAQREQEIEALKQALTILENWQS